VKLENSLHKAQALRDIKRLQYSYAHYAELGLWNDLGDLFATNGTAHYAQYMKDDIALYTQAIKDAGGRFN